MKRTYYFIFLLFLGCGKKLNDSERIISPITLDMNTLRWESSQFPINLKVSDNLDSDSQTLINDALNEWERVGKKDFFQPLETTHSHSFSNLIDYYEQDRFVQGIYLAKNKIQDMNDASLAVAQIIYYADTTSSSTPFYHIVHTDIIINGYDYTFSTDRWDDTTYYIMTLVLHEVGHVLGLAHQSKGIMYPSMSTMDKLETLSSFEADLLQEKYAAPKIPLEAVLIPSKDPSPSQKYERALLYLPFSKIKNSQILKSVLKQKNV